MRVVKKEARLTIPHVGDKGLPVADEVMVALEER